MAKIIPFRAVRPTRDKVFSHMPFLWRYVTAELAAQLDFNPLSFAYHKPAYNNQKRLLWKKIQIKYKKYEDFKIETVKDKKPAIYIHKIVTKTQAYTNYSRYFYRWLCNNKIKKHEETPSV
jgi:hypothetical protein